MAKDLNIARRALEPAQTQDSSPEPTSQPTQDTPAQTDPLAFGPFGAPTFSATKAKPYNSEDGKERTVTLARVTFPILAIPGAVLVAMVKQRIRLVVVDGQNRSTRETYMQMANFGAGTGYASGLEATTPAAESAMEDWRYNVAEAADNWYNDRNKGAVTTADTTRRRVIKMYDADGNIVGSAAHIG